MTTSVHIPVFALEYNLDESEDGVAAGMVKRVRVDRDHAATLCGQFAFYSRLLGLEFEGLSSASIYELAFSRLLKPDPLGSLRGATDGRSRPSMLGADERDLMLPRLRNLFAELPPTGADVFDFGSGDGQTVALAIESSPADTRFNFEEPNASYLRQYAHMVRSRPVARRVGSAVGVGFEEMISGDLPDGVEVPPKGVMHACLAIHMVYFLKDLRRCLNAMIDFLRPGGVLFLAVADSVHGFSAKTIAHYVGDGSGGGASNLVHHREEWSDLLGARNHQSDSRASREWDATEPVRKGLERADVSACAERQLSRLYGNDLGDLMALGFITGLAGLGDAPLSAKIKSVRSVLETHPEAVDLALETEGARAGMWSLSEPQLLVTIRRDEK